MNNYKEDINWDIATKVLSGEASQQEINHIDDWIQQKPENKEEWMRIRESLIQSEEAMINESINVNDAWLNVQKRMSSPKVKIHKTWLIYAAAAIILLAIGIFTPLLITQHHITSYLSTLLQQELPDGSVIDLNKQSEIVLAKQFGKQTRTVQLNGEAFFNIKPNEKIPFIIQMNHIKVTVTGTSFNIKNTSHFTKIDITSGTVKVDIQNQPTIYLTKGDQLSYNSQTGIIEQRKSMNYNFMAWKTHKLNFKHQKLSEVIVTLEELYDVKITFPDSIQSSELYLTATFSNHNIDFISNVLSKTFNTSFSYINVQN